MSLIKGQHLPEPGPASGQQTGPNEEQWPQIPQALPGRVDREGTAEPGPQPIRRLMGHRLLVMVCCIPVLVIVGVLILTGVPGWEAIVYALACTVMMAAMMFMMPGGKQH